MTKAKQTTHIRVSGDSSGGNFGDHFLKLFLTLKCFSLILKKLNSWLASLPLIADKLCTTHKLRGYRSRVCSFRAFLFGTKICRSQIQKDRYSTTDYSRCVYLLPIASHCHIEGTATNRKWINQVAKALFGEARLWNSLKLMLMSVIAWLFFS